MIEKFRYIKKRIKTDKKFVLMFVLYLVTLLGTSIAFMHWEEYVSKVAFIFLLISLMFLTLFTWSMAALAVFRSLLVVGAGLTLILFIAQSYCALPIQEQVSSDSLKSLIGIGIFFIGITFVVRLYGELFGNPHAKREFDKMGALKVFRDANKGKDSIFVLIFYAVFMGLILGQLFEVLYPIFSNLCVY